MYLKLGFRVLAFILRLVKGSISESATPALARRNKLSPPGINRNLASQATNKILILILNSLNASLVNPVYEFINYEYLIALKNIRCNVLIFLFFELRIPLKVLLSIAIRIDSNQMYW